ncbi:MAG TPA: hypothetical protein VN915_14565 [Elusimicrobiota bacterium]|nr:hypothetical protein [Elusimicrobiota bacterium]
MVRTVRAWGLLALGLVVLTVPSFAEELGGAFEAAKAAVQASALEAAGKPVPQSGRDLYYFTKEEAAAAKKKWAFREQTVINNKDLVFDSDVPADIQAQMRADMAFMGTIKGSGATPLHKKIFGAVDGATYLKFFNTRVSGIGMDDCGSAKAVACVIPFQDPSKMWLTQNFIKFDHPQISRMMIVFHEARHTESRNGNWPHATCPTPFLDANGKDMVSIWTGATLAGEPACDVTPLGSYGSSTILLKNVQKYCANCTDKVKMDAGLYADDQMGRITDDGAKQEMLDDFQK